MILNKYKKKYLDKLKYKFKCGDAVLNWHGSKWKGKIISKDFKVDNNENVIPLYEFTTLNRIAGHKAPDAVLNIHWKFEESLLEQNNG